MKFKYQFESIKRIKETLEKKTKKELATIGLQIEKTKHEIEKLENARKALHLDITAKNNHPAATLQFRSHYDDYLEQQINQHEKEIVQLEELKEAKIAELAQKRKDTKIFEALEEKQFEEYLKNENKSEQIQIDEIGVQKFVRGNL